THGNRNRTARSHGRNERGRVERTEERARAPACIQPAITDGAGVKYVVAERRGHYHTGHHRAQKKCPADSQRDYGRMAAQEIDAFTHLAYKARDRGFRG